MNISKKTIQKNFFLRNIVLITFIIILLIGLYLRFYNFVNIINYGWDQARDAWKARDILHGQLVLDGPRTGVGHFHLGPLWFYLLAPFYYITNLDPIGSIYLNVLVNIFNFISIFWITKKIYNEKAALFITLIFAISKYSIEITQTPWNVSPVPGISLLIFYCIYSIVLKNNYKLIPWLAFLTGLFFHIHFSIVFLIPIILISLLFAKDKKRILINGILSSPLFFIWFIPTIIYQIRAKNTDIILFSDFLKNYWIAGFHLKFLLFRLNDAFIQFQTVLSLSHKYNLLKFVLPLIYIVVLVFEKNYQKKIFGFLLLLWFIIPAVMYSFYAGSTSEYYVLFNLPMVLFIVYSLQEKLLSLRFKPFSLSILFVIWMIYIYYNTFNLWVKPTYGGLAKIKEEFSYNIKNIEKYPFDEGDIKSYLYYTCKEDHKQC